MYRTALMLFTGKRDGYGGGKNLFAGLITCGHCKAVLTVTSPQRVTRRVTCACCSQEKMCGVRDTAAGSVSVNGIVFLLRSLIQGGLGPEEQDQFHSRLQARRVGGRGAELTEARDALARIQRICKNLAATMVEVEDDPYLAPQFKKAIRRFPFTSSVMDFSS